MRVKRLLYGIEEASIKYLTVIILRYYDDDKNNFAHPYYYGIMCTLFAWQQFNVRLIDYNCRKLLFKHFLFFRLPDRLELCLKNITMVIVTRLLLFSIPFWKNRCERIEVFKFLPVRWNINRIYHGLIWINVDVHWY